MSQAVIKSLFAQRSRDFLKDVLSRYTDEGPKAPDILLVVKTTHPGVVLPDYLKDCLLYTSPSPRDGLLSRMPSSA